MTETYFLSDKFWFHLELFGFLTGIVYLYLELKQKTLMWIVGSASSAVYVIIFAFAKIYADMCFNFYNLIIGLYGLTLWLKSVDPDEETIETGGIEYNHITRKMSIRLIILAFALYSTIYYILSTFTDSPIPIGDSFTTTLSIIAVYLLAKKIIEHWLLWIVINFASLFLYSMRGLDLTVVLYIIYTVASFYGYYLWKKKGVLISKNESLLAE